MVDPTTFQLVVTVAGALAGWWLKVIWESLKDLQQADADLAKSVASIQVLVAGSYVTRSEMTDLTQALFKKLDRIEEKLDGKADK